RVSERVSRAVLQRLSRGRSRCDPAGGRVRGRVDRAAVRLQGRRRAPAVAAPARGQSTARLSFGFAGLLPRRRAMCYRKGRPLRRLKLNDFSGLKLAELEFVDGINVFVGGNGRGKTHVLKVMYALTESLRSHPPLGLNLPGVFKPQDDHIGRLA